MKRIRLIFTLAMVAGFAAAASPSPAQQTAAQQLEARAKALDAQGRHDLAADNWRQLLLIDPRQPEALAALAAYSRSIGDSVHANGYLQQLRASGGAAAATPAPSGAGGGDPRLQAAARLASARNFSDSLALYRQVFGATPPPGPWAVAYYETEAAVPQELPAALAGLRSLILKYPQDPTYQLSLGKVLTYRPATRPEGAQILAALHGSAAQNEQARAAWRQAILWDPTGPAALQTGARYLERYPDPELAARLKAEEARPAKAEPVAESPLEGEGYKALGAGDLALAREKFSALLALPGSVGKAHAGLGYVEMQQGNFSAAAENFQQAKAHGLQNPAIDKSLNESRYFQAMSEGNKALKASDFDAAVLSFTRARQIDSQRPEALEALAGSLVADGQPAKAEAIFAELVKRSPDHLDAWIEWFDAMLNSGDARQVLETQGKMATATSRKLEQRVDYLAILAAANKSLGDDAAAQRLMDRVQETASRSGAQSAAAQLRAAGLLMQAGNTDGATQLCRAVVQLDRGNVEAWQMLVRAAHIAGDDVSAMSLAERMPDAVYKAALKNPEFLMTLAAIDQARQQYEQAARLLERVRSSAPEGWADSPRFLLQSASLDLASGNPERAYGAYRKVASEYPDQLAAWSGMLAALHEGSHDQEALLAIQKIPADLAPRLQNDAAFLQVLAAIYSETGHSRQAVDSLRMVSAIYQQRSQPVPFSVDTQYAWLLLNQGDQRQLAVTLDRLGDHRNLTSDQKLELENIWAAWSMRRAEADYSAGNGRKALTVLQIATQAYPDSTTLRRELCSMYVRTGNPAPALKIYEDMNWESARLGDYVSAVDAALVAHRVPAADKWLQDGLQRYPGNDQLLSLGARLEEQRGDIRKARQYLLAVIDHSNAEPGLPADPARPVLAGFPRLEDDGEPAASASPEKTLAQMLSASSGTPLRLSKPVASYQATPAAKTTAPLRSLPDLPSSSPSTRRSLTGDGASPLLQNIHPSAYSSSDMPIWPAKNSAAPLPATLPANDLQESTAVQLSDATLRLVTRPLPDERPRPAALLRQAVFSGVFAASALVASSAQQAATDSGSQTSISQDPAAQNLTAQDSTTPDPTTQDPTTQDPTVGTPIRSFTAATPAAFSETGMASQQQASDQLAALESRYSPYVGGGGYLNSHTGTQGFDRLQRFEATSEASSVFDDSIRFTVVTHPVLLESGVPDATSNYRFGSQPVAGATTSQAITRTSSNALPTTDQFSSGYSGELQVAAKFVQGSVGYSPANFPVTHLLGSITVQPGNFPLSFGAYRQNVTDTMLSYAGLNDPYSGKTWGGVVATGGAIKYAQGSGLSGFYASFDGQQLTGKNVAKNTRYSGGTGAYFQVYGSRYGVLKVGANLTAMHYDKNERYFTFGQGGYFSPSSFLLMNAPVTWQGTPMHNFAYTLNGSLGVQTFQDDPAMPGSLVTGTGAQSITGASYDFHAKGAYHLNQHWLLEAFLDANNARDYRNTAGGFSVRYLIRPVPAEGGPTGLIDERQLRPLAIP